MKKYPEFLKRFPTVQDLAKSPLIEVLKVWQGMGYNRRAIALQQIAKEVVWRFHGTFPRSVEVLRKFPGIGAATAGSFLAFAFNKPSVFIETNIRRVVIHAFFPGVEKVDDKKIVPILREALPKRRAREWYWALMDYGAGLTKHVPNPNRRSRSYAKQSPFAGSLRELRGKILKALVAHSSLSKKQLQARFLLDRRLGKALTNLTREGFLKKTKGAYSLK
jgi:A/G-specific adenine glycosylase